MFPLKKVKIDYFRLMKNQFLLFLLFSNYQFSFGQKKYSFDYAIQYNFQANDSSKVQNRFYLTNSKDNSYVLQVTEKDDLNYNLFFIDQNGIASTTYLSKKDFFDAEIINLKCDFVSRYRNPFKYQTDNYDFINQKDTLINNISYSMYIIKSNKPKREKRKRLATLHFVVEKNTDFHLPILLEITPYEEWKKERNIPNGIPKQFYFTNYLNNTKTFIYNLVDFVKINRLIIIPNECDYTNPDVFTPKIIIR